MTIIYEVITLTKRKPTKIKRSERKSISIDRTNYEYHGGFLPYEDPADYVKISVKGTVIA